jgi:hypothetical protein
MIVCDDLSTPNGDGNQRRRCVTTLTAFGTLLLDGLQLMPLISIDLKKECDED